ncbi:NAD(P)H-hydrate dehydratase [Dellaglioa algida]|uniref:ADP-dependent (S)-NAD(P)H-hydrate dehydratase n=1 Tax=Dellaglioa algida TaxID=105612 RepID=A0A2C8EUA8_9LACO|nr:NAD(P)H-hydrate dehydratase [Dellaglioa algida]MDK1716588.1 hypothetical protein [Dellaglioa algida]MDK1718464.1 hypothetical protein [Dellaglioa algida]MDK1720093.1 hypothetical protein [Dellaglioa algida]MDK1721530.1 hypothetical protein [Dellaglioa algida]MDK1723482.1 hypothetical protein [Dellaglioa algida]
MEKISKSILTNIFNEEEKQVTQQRIVVVGGNENGGGSAFITAKSALYSSGNPVTTATDKLNLGALYANLPETDYINYFDKVLLADAISNASVIVAGPGLGSDLRSSDILDVVLANASLNQTLILSDAALKIIKESEHPLPKTNLILVMDEAEWANFSNVPIEQQTSDSMEIFQQKNNAIIVIKKTNTELYLKDGSVLTSPLKTSQTSTNSLTGIITGLATLSSNTSETVAAAIYLHGYIEDQISRSQFPVLPSRIVDNIPLFLKEFTL